MLALVFRPEELRAHRGRRRQRNDQRYPDGHGKRYRKLAEQPSDDAAHQEDRDEDRNQRCAHRKYGKRNLLRSRQCRHRRPHSHFEIPADVLNHNDRVIDHKPGRDRQRHQRQVVHAVAHQVHRSESAEQRKRDRNAGDDRCRNISQENEHDQNHKQYRDQDRVFDVGDRRANRRCAIGDDGKIDGRRNRCPQLSKQRIYAVDRLNDIRRRLLQHVDQHGRLAVCEAGIAPIFQRVLDPGDVGEPYRSSLVVGDDQRPILRSLKQLVGGGQPPGQTAVRHLSLRAIRIRRGKRRADLVPADVVFRQGRGIDLDTNRRTRAALNLDLSDSADLRDLLIEDRIGNVIHPAPLLDIRSQGQGQYGLIRRIVLAVTRITRQVCG